MNRYSSAIPPVVTALSGTFTSYTTGTDLTLSAGFRACFKATDSVGNVSYASSGVGIATAPGIVDPVEPVLPIESVDDILPTINIGTVANNRISTTLTGDLSNSPILEFQIISDNVCSSSTTGTFEAYTIGTTLTLPIGSRACFKVTDSAGRSAYAVSAAGKKAAKRKRSTTTQQSSPQQPQLEVSVLTGDTLSATDNYAAGSTTMFYRIQTDDACDSTFEDAFNAYQEGTVLNPTVGGDYYVRFRSVDNDDSNNVAYSVSALVVVEIAPGSQPADPADNERDLVDPTNNNGETDTDSSPSTPDPGGTVVEPDPRQPADPADPDPDPDDDTDAGDPDNNNDETDIDSSPSTSDSDSSGYLFILIGTGLLTAVLVLVVIKEDPIGKLKSQVCGLVNGACLGSTVCHRFFNR